MFWGLKRISCMPAIFGFLERFTSGSAHVLLPSSDVHSHSHVSWFNNIFNEIQTRVRLPFWKKQSRKCNTGLGSRRDSSVQTRAFNWVCSSRGDQELDALQAAVCTMILSTVVPKRWNDKWQVSRNLVPLIYMSSMLLPYQEQLQHKTDHGGSPSISGHPLFCRPWFRELQLYEWEHQLNDAHFSALGTSSQVRLCHQWLL